MKESRQEIITAIQKADMEANLFLLSFGTGMEIFQQIADEAMRERQSSLDSDLNSIFGGYGPDGEDDEKEKVVPATINSHQAGSVPPRSGGGWNKETRRTVDKRGRIANECHKRIGSKENF